MQDQERIKAIYSVLTGQPYAEGSSLLLDQRDLWKSADILFRFFAPTDAHIGALLLYKFGGAQPEKAELEVPLVVVPEEEKSLAPNVQEGSQEVPVLSPGGIPWKVEIDGIPVTWRLDYAQSHLPVTKGKLCRFGGNLYRVSKVYGTTLHLSSQESEVYRMNHDEVIHAR